MWSLITLLVDDCLHVLSFVEMLAILGNLLYAMSHTFDYNLSDMIYPAYVYKVEENFMTYGIFQCIV